MSEILTVTAIASVILFIAQLYNLWQLRQNRRELDSVEARLNRIRENIDATRDRLKLPK